MIRPLADRVVLEPKEAETKTASGLYIPDTAKEKPQQGTVVAVGSNGSRQCDVSSWTNIVAISTGSSHTIGLKADGTAVAIGSDSYGQCNVSDWKGIRLP